MKVSETTQKAYEGISKILKENGQGLSKSQTYAVESLLETVEEAIEKRCCEMTEQIIAKKDAVMESKEATTLQKVNEMVENRVEELKKEVPEVLDYAKMKKMQECIEQVKECVGYRSDEQVERVAAESAKMLHSTKELIETQAKTISERTASLGESTKRVNELTEKVRQMQATIEAKEKQIVESTKKNAELVGSVQALQKKVEESKKINESIEEKRKSESLKFYLEEKVSKYPKYEAALLRKHFQNAKSRAEIDENFQKALSMVSEKRDAMRTVQAIPVTRVDEATKKISGGETIVKENGGTPTEAMKSLYDESFVDIDNDVISNEDMQRWISRL